MKTSINSYFLLDKYRKSPLPIPLDVVTIQINNFDNDNLSSNISTTFINNFMANHQVIFMNTIGHWYYTILYFYVPMHDFFFLLKKIAVSYSVIFINHLYIHY